MMDAAVYEAFFASYSYFTITDEAVFTSSLLFRSVTKEDNWNGNYCRFVRYIVNGSCEYIFLNNACVLFSKKNGLRHSRSR